MPWRLKAASYCHMSADWPTAAAACFSGIERGRSGERQARHAGGDRARGHQHDSRRPSRTRGDLGGQRRDPLGVGAGARRGDEAAADLHDEPAHAAERADALRRPAPARPSAIRSPRGAAATGARDSSARPAARSPAEITKNGRPARARRTARRRSRLGAASEQVGLVGHDDLRPRGQRPPSRRASSASITSQVLERVAPVWRIEVEHVQEQPRALGVAEELMPEPLALGGAGDEPGQVGDDEASARRRRARCRARAPAS